MKASTIKEKLEALEKQPQTDVNIKLKKALEDKLEKLEGKVNKDWSKID